MISLKRILILTLLAFFLVACGKESPESSPTSDNKEEVEIDFWTFWGSELRRPIIERIINDFNENYQKEVKNIKSKSNTVIILMVTFGRRSLLRLLLETLLML